MSEKHLAQLEKGGLSSAEAQIYLALVRNGGSMRASAIVVATGVPRGSVYPTLTRLTDMGLVEAEAGYGGRFSAIPAERALPSLILREREELGQREQILNELAKELTAVAEPATALGDAEQIQVIRDPRVATSRFERLQQETERNVDAFVKFPIFNLDHSNPRQVEAMQRGVRYRTVYEAAVLDTPEVKPYLASWIAAGEEARVYDGKLPHKLVVFDEQNILLPLVTPGRPTRTLFIRHPQLGASLTLLFDSFWNASKPVPSANLEKSLRVPPASLRQPRARERSQRGTGPTNHR